MFYNVNEQAKHLRLFVVEFLMPLELLEIIELHKNDYIRTSYVQQGQQPERKEI
jgi:hypothetical protein